MRFRILKNGTGTYKLQFKRSGLWWDVKEHAYGQSLLRRFTSAMEAKRKAESIVSEQDRFRKLKQWSVVEEFEL